MINGLSHDFGDGLIAGLCILLLAIVIDRITQARCHAGDRSAKGGQAIGWFFGTSRGWRAAVK